MSHISKTNQVSAMKFISADNSLNKLSNEYKNSALTSSDNLPCRPKVKRLDFFRSKMHDFLNFKYQGPTGRDFYMRFLALVFMYYFSIIAIIPFVSTFLFIFGCESFVTFDVFIVFLNYLFNFCRYHKIFFDFKIGQI